MNEKNSRHPHLPAIACAAAAIALAACANKEIEQPGPFALARLQPTQGSTVEGELRLTQVGNRLRLSGEIKGLAPNTEHGFHVHEKGDCSSPDATSAGGHFNPAASAHGAHGSAAAHAGDLPSLKSDANGVAPVFFETPQLALGSGPNNVIGRSLIVHRDPDDFKTQPTGNSGPRLACAVVAKSA